MHVRVVSRVVCEYGLQLKYDVGGTNHREAAAEAAAPAAAPELQRSPWTVPAEQIQIECQISCVGFD